MTVAARWIDNHCHLEPGPAAAEAIAEARAGGVERLITVGTDVAGSRSCIDIARDHAQVWATAGVHPHDAAGGIDGLEELLADPVVVAVGECGLDYHYDHSPRDAQRAVFAQQVELAHRHGLPLMIHTRSAWDDTFAILDDVGVPDRTVFHCFTGGPAEAEQCLGRGAHLSFSGIVTFPSAPEVREAAILCPADRILVETDAPFLAPVPHRGEKNRPALVSVVGEAVAEARNVEPAELAARIWATASAIYTLDRT
jgi:TatD DNase family protein